MQINRLAVVLSYSTLFMLGLADNIRGPLFPEVLNDLHLSDTKGALFWSASSLMAFVASVLSGPVLSGLGSLGTLRFSLFMMFCGQLGMAYSQDYIMALVSCFCFGASFGFLGVIQNILVLKAGPPHVIQRLQAGLHSNYALASLIAPLYLTLAYWIKPGWRFGYTAGAFISFLGFVVLLFVPSRKLKQEKRIKSSFVLTKEKFAVIKKSLWLGAIIAFYVVAEVMVSSRLALFLRRKSGFDFTTSSYATTGFFVCLFLGRALFVFWKPKRSLKTMLSLFLISSFLILIIGLLKYPLILILSGLTMAPFYPLAMAYLGEKFPSQLHIAMSTALALSGLFVVLMHYLVGSFSDLLGMQTALWIGPAVILMAFALLRFDDKLI